MISTTNSASHFLSNCSNKNCLNVCKLTMSKMGQTNFGSSANVLYLASENDSHTALVHYGDPTHNYTKAIDCINRHLDAGLAIIAGVNHTLEKKINDGTIDHFVLIVAREYNSDSGLYEYLYVETRTNNPGNGYNSGNRFIFDPTIDMYVDNSARIGPIKGGPNTYTLTELRPNDGDNSGTITQPALRIFRFFKI